MILELDEKQQTINQSLKPGFQDVGRGSGGWGGGDKPPLKKKRCKSVKSNGTKQTI